MKTTNRADRKIGRANIRNIGKRMYEGIAIKEAIAYCSGPQESGSVNSA
jgi:hypothetical protein